MNNAQKLIAAFALANLILVLLFPPSDYISLQQENIPTFDGFYFAFGSRANRLINSSFLALEVIVVLINAAIAWLLFREPTERKQKQPGGNRAQRRILALIAINLVVALLFPPFENYSAITKATLPTFEGFYFVLADNSRRQIVSAILYIEVALIVINGALLWLLFKDKAPEDVTAEQLKVITARMRTTKKP
jgi:heme/copper-type cytochrome/quinol oxidase subunit 2